jgi:hypothetical protein
VYKVKCADCPIFYIGQTGWAFKVRYKEHRPDVRTDIQKSSFAQHLVDTNHDMADINDELEVLNYCNKGNRMDVLEEYEIYKSIKTCDPILNDKLQFKSNFIFNALLHRQGSITSAEHHTDNEDNRTPRRCNPDLNVSAVCSRSPPYHVG